MATANLLQTKRKDSVIHANSGGHRYCVLYLKRGINEHQKEFRSPWFSSRERAHQACQIMKRRYGEKSAIVYID